MAMSIASSMVNMSSVVVTTRSSSELKVLNASSKVMKCSLKPANVSLCSLGFYSRGFHFAPLVALSSSSFFPSSGRRICTWAQADAQSTDPLVENKEADVEDETVLDQILSEESSDDEVPDADSTEDDVEEEPTSFIVTALQSYKEALLDNDESKVAEIESYLQSLEEEKVSLTDKVASLTEELLSLKDKVLRISADFDNYRKRTERDRLSLVTNVQGDVVESLLPVLDNFERAKASIKLQTEGEEKINSSYQSIYNQFAEVLKSLGVVPVDTVGSPFDPLLHEAIMREDSSEFEEGIVIQEFRKGFRLGDKLLRPSMVKVSAGPGPEKPKEVETIEEPEAGSESSESGESS